MPRVRVVVLNWNSWWFTRRCLAALARTEHPADRLEVVLVDNASVDGSLERLRQEFPDVRIVRNGANLGFAEGCNRAMRDLRGIDMVALVNNDAVVEPGWLAALVVGARRASPRRCGRSEAGARAHVRPAPGGRAGWPGPGVLGAGRRGRTPRRGPASRARSAPRVAPNGRWSWSTTSTGSPSSWCPWGDGEHLVELTVEGRGRVTSSCGRPAEVGAAQAEPARRRARPTAAGRRCARRTGRVAERTRHRAQRGRGELRPALRRAERSGGRARSWQGHRSQVTGFSGGGVLLRSELLAQVGLFDPAFFAYYEDSDLSWRAARAGWGTVAAARLGDPPCLRRFRRVPGAGVLLPQLPQLAAHRAAQRRGRPAAARAGLGPGAGALGGAGQRGQSAPAPTCSERRTGRRVGADVGRRGSGAASTASRPRTTAGLGAHRRRAWRVPARVPPPGTVATARGSRSWSRWT